MERQSERGMVPLHLLSWVLNAHVNMQAKVKTGRRFMHFLKVKGSIQVAKWKGSHG